MPGDMDMDRRSSSSTEGQVADLISTLLIHAVTALLPKKQETEETMTLYYRLDNSKDDKNLNSSVTNFVTKPVTDRYAAISNRYMCDSTFSKPNSDIISFIGTRTPKNSVFDKNMYYNSVCITSGLDLIQAVANYEDNGNSVETKVESQEFVITGKTGKFSKFNKLVINFYNDTDNQLAGFEGYGPIRTVVFSRR
jgi:hypothetical protein